MIGYKVCKLTGDGYKSCVAQHKLVEYIPYKWTKPHKNCGPLAVFKEIGFALKFYDPYNDVILKCKYKKSRYNKLWVDIDGYIHTTRGGFPLGTRFARKVKIMP